MQFCIHIILAGTLSSLQVNYPPYLFEVVLYRPVDDTKSNAQVGGGTVVFSLQKKEPGIWSRLSSTQSGMDVNIISSLAFDKQSRKIENCDLITYITYIFIY